MGTVFSCSPTVTNNGIVAVASGSVPAPPYPEDPSIAIATDGNGTPYLVDASDECGVVFFELAFAATNWPSGLLYPKFMTTHRSDYAVGTPVISSFLSYALVPEQSTLKAYDFTTGKQIKKWSVPNVPPGPLAVALNSAFITNAGGIVQVPTDQPSLPWVPSYPLGHVYSIAVTLTMTYVLGDDGVYALGPSFELQSFVPIPSGISGPGGALAVLSNGSLVLASRNGTTYIFPPN
jgi:hypothetical protein